jgi:SAM-dependent methyltransferase
MVLPTLLCCQHCRHGLVSNGNGAYSCSCGSTEFHHQDGVYLTSGLPQAVERERVVRDQQAFTYLQHAKFPTQIASIRAWLEQVVARSAAISRPLALDLGCGPGPCTQLLLEAGFDVVAIDTSPASLLINAAACRAGNATASACFVQQDLNRLALQPASVDVVLMADFIQHLGGRAQREHLLREVAAAMKPGAHFYASFFNLNFWHYLKGDVHGGFAGGAIRYERLTLRNMLEALPETLVVDRKQALNVFHAAGPDRIVTRLPGAYLLARMAAISGRKTAALEMP